MLNTVEMPGVLERWFAEQGHPCEVTGYRLMSGGFSRTMARVDVRWPDGTTEALVMRGDPPPELATLESDRDAEWALLRALHGGAITTPAARFYEGDRGPFGTKAIFMEHVDGGSLQAQLDAGTAPPDVTERFVDLMAAVATTEPGDLPASLTRPTSWDDYLDAAVGRWRDVAHRHVESMPITRYIAAWLDHRRPDPVALRLVHGDLHPGNIVAHPDEWHLVDWEFSRIGDPREDLGYYNAYSGAVPPNLAAADVDAFLARFRERTGLGEEHVNPLTFGYFTVLATVGVVSGMYDALRETALGQRRGVANTFNVHLVGIGNAQFLGAIEQMEAAMAAADG